MAPEDWEAATRRREHEAVIACAQSIDRFNAWVESIAQDEALDIDRLLFFPRPPPSRQLMGPIEAQMRTLLGLLNGDPHRLLPFPPATAVD